MSGAIMRAARTLIVDDEKPARDRLRQLLARDSRVELTASCAGGAEALDALRTAARTAAPVQLIFLDVQMPELDGFGVLSTLMRERPPIAMPEVVFVTAYDEYALQAFEAHATAYLLKPFSDEKFQATLDHALRHVRAGHAEAVMSQLQALLAMPAGTPPVRSPARTMPGRTLDRLVVRGLDRVRLLPVEQISWIEADGMYVKLHTRDGAAHLHRALLRALDATLDPRRFVRIHRSAIVNIDVVTELRQEVHGDYLAVLRDGTEIRVGRRFRARLQARLGQQI
jgi:two-component system, LytTR family, response regulator